MSAVCKSGNSDNNQRANYVSFINPVKHFTSKFESMCPEILIPGTEHGMIQLVNLVCSRELENSPQERFAIASACFAAIYYMGPTLRKLVQDFIPYKLLLITSIFQELNYTGDESELDKYNIEIGVNLALMFLTSIGNTIDSDSYIEFQTERFNALADDANLSTFEPNWQIPLYIINALSHIFKSYPAFVLTFAKQFLIPDIEILSTFENALKIHVKPILFQVDISDFQLSYYLIREIINSPLIEIKEIQDEMDKPFHEACIFFRKQLDVKNPFTRLLNLSSSSVLDSKNFPSIHYAAKCIISIDTCGSLPQSLYQECNYSPVHKRIKDAVFHRKEYFEQF